MFFTNLLFGRRRIRRPMLRRLAPRRSVFNQVGGNGTDIFYNSITVTSSKPSPVPVTEVTTPTYTATVRDYFLCVDHSGLVTITLPFGVLGTVYIIKDCSGNAFTYPITIQGIAQTVDGGTATINSNYGSITVIFNGTEWSIV